jgi:hypothetical protein
MKASPDRKNNFTGKSASKPDAIKNPVVNDVEKKIGHYLTRPR